MPFVPAPNSAMVELVYQWAGQTCENTLYFTRNAAIDVADMTTLAASISAWWQDDIRDEVSSAVSLVAIRVTNLTTELSPGIEYVVGMPITGGLGATPALPNNVTAAVKFITNLRGRSYRGRNYVVGLAEGQVAANVINGSVVVAYVTGYGELNNNVGAEGWEHVVLSRIEDGAFRTIAHVEPVTGYAMDDIIDSQRRRLPGRGV